MTDTRRRYIRPLDLASGRVEMGHGAGGRTMAQLIEELFEANYGLEVVREAGLATR